MMGSSHSVNKCALNTSFIYIGLHFKSQVGLLDLEINQLTKVCVAAVVGLALVMILVKVSKKAFEHDDIAEACFNSFTKPVQHTLPLNVPGAVMNI